MPPPPVIIRELREEARRPATNRSRALAVTAVVFVLTIVWLDDGIDEGDGGALFGTLNNMFCVCVWLIVPITTADCISRERREGTLPLLFLTPLTPTGILLGKTFCHALRAFGLLLAVLPAMLICFMLGGLGWQTCAIALCMDSASILLALSAGFVASSHSIQWNRAMGLTFVVCLLSLYIYTSVIHLWTMQFNLGWWDQDLGFAQRIGLLFQFGFGAGGTWSVSNWMFGTAVGYQELAGLCAYSLIYTLLVSLTSALCAIRRIKAVRRMDPPSKRREEVEKAVWKPRFWHGRFRNRTNRMLDRNPIGWLQRYSTGSRLVGWFWLFAVIAVESWILVDQLWNVDEWSVTLGLFMTASVAYIASGSFLRERQSGALELLLVTPLRVDQIIRGRLFGIWGMFAGPAILIAGSFAYSLTWNTRYFASATPALLQGSDTAFMFFLFPWLLVTTAIIGLHFSLTRRSFLAALLSTVSFGAVIPLALLILYDGLMSKLGMSWFELENLIRLGLEVAGIRRLISVNAAVMFLLATIQLPIAIWAFRGLINNLKNRRFMTTTA